MDESDWLSGTDAAAMLRLVWENPDHVNINCNRSERKLRLFACACCRLAWDRLTDDAPCGRCRGQGTKWLRSPGTVRRRGEAACPDCGGTGRTNRSRRAVEVAERFADGEATEQETIDAWRPVSSWEIASVASHVANSADWAARHIVGGSVVGPCPSPAAQANLIRCLWGNPFRPVTAGDGEQLPFVPTTAAAAETVLALAAAAYEERLGTGLLDPQRLAVLSDALEEAGLDPRETSCGRATDPIIAHLRSGGPHARGCWCVDLLTGRE